MNTKKEWENILKAEMILLARELVAAGDKADWNELSDKFQKLHEKLAAFRYLTQNDAWDAFSVSEDMAFAEKSREVIPETDKKVQNHSPSLSVEHEKKEEKKAAPVKNENKSGHPLDGHREAVMKAARTRFAPKKNRQLPPLNIGLGDKIAFVKHLFDNDNNLFTRFVNEINQAEGYEDALEVVQSYKDKLQWDGKDEYEFRLLQLIHARYSL